MIGSFGFGTNNYGRHAPIWTNIVFDFGLISHVNIHPQSGSEHYWESNFPVRYDPGCLWSDGSVGGFCSELFTPEGVEAGSLVNPLGHSVDVGFGFERVPQVMEGKSRVDETELFDLSLDPVSRDHFRTLSVFKEQGIGPGNRGRNYVCRRLMRRLIRLNPEGVEGPFSDWNRPNECGWRNRSRMHADIGSGIGKKSEAYQTAFMGIPSGSCPKKGSS
jgi:hypothetical protein